MEDTNINNYDINKDEYIHSLEIAVQLLQREVDSLRSKSSSNEVGESGQMNSESMLHSFKDFDTVEEVIESLHSAIKTSFNILESNIYILNEDNYHSEIADSGTSSLLNQQVQIIEEQGLIDLVINEKEYNILPNNTESDESLTFFILIPLFLRNKYQGIFVAKTNQGKENYSEIDMNTLNSLAESALYVIDNIKSSEEINKMNIRLHNLNTELSKSSNTPIDDLSDMIFREINTSMDIISANTKFIASGIGDATTRCNIINNEISKVKSIKDKILKTKGKNDFNLIDLVERIISISSSQLRRDGIRIELESSIEKLILHLPQVQLEQVLLKILLFSRDTFYEEGKININLFEEKDAYHLMISDNSNGIEENELLNIFDPMVNSDMYMVKKILEELDIKIVINSQFGKGNTFKLYFNK